VRLVRKEENAMLDEADIRDLMTRDVVDPEGKSVGNVETFFKDRSSGRPEWFGVFAGTFRAHHYLVPVQGAERAGTAVRVPWTKQQVHSAPATEIRTSQSPRSWSARPTATTGSNAQASDLRARITPDRVRLSGGLVAD
jgi:hypothetical protein